MKYYFDLDETLCLTPASRDYTQAIPLVKVISEVNKLFDDGHEITIYTARGGSSGVDYHALNIDQLSSWGVKYHNLIDTGKPPYDILVDDKAINTTAWREQQNIRLVGFVASCFDLLHAGHCLYLKEANSLCDHLIAGLQTDPTIDRSHKNKPIQSVTERAIQLQACRYVDEVVQYQTETELEHLLKSIKPDIRFLGSDCQGKPITGSQHSDIIYFHNRSYNYSSSELRERITMNVNEKIDALVADLEYAEHQFLHIHGDCCLTHFRHCFPHVELSGLWLEFGVFKGGSIGTIANCNPNHIIYGFDSFDGLPEEWNEDNPKGSFSLQGEIPPKIFRGENIIHGKQYQDWNTNIVLVKGLFEDTLPTFVAEHPENVAFMHIDSDLYSSAKTIFNELKDRIVSGTVICFDDWCGYPLATNREHEIKAFAEFLLETGLNCGPPLSHQTDSSYSQVGYKLK